MSDRRFIKFLCKMIWKLYCGNALNGVDWDIIKQEMVYRSIDPDEVFTQ